MALCFQPLSTADLRWVLPIERLAHPMPWAAEHFPCSDALHNGEQGWALWHDEIPVGYWVGLFVADEAHLLNLTVDPQRQRQGYGRQLLTHFLAESRRQGSTTVWLEVRSDNEGALALYRAFGFVTQVIRRRYYRDRAGNRQDALVMSLTVGQRDETA